MTPENPCRRRSQSVPAGPAGQPAWGMEAFERDDAARVRRIPPDLARLDRHGKPAAGIGRHEEIDGDHGDDTTLSGRARAGYSGIHSGGGWTVGEGVGPGSGRPLPSRRLIARTTMSWLQIDLARQARADDAPRGQHRLLGHGRRSRLARDEFHAAGRAARVAAARVQHVDLAHPARCASTRRLPGSTSTVAISFHGQFRHRA